ncbi:conserved hypothetical protein [Pediculus humanus corporis]|uniref:BLOC-1-related complex subunit 7 n=2 Tax=Pediculus humanus subsp. corporis TaxID=121224 RepID=E0VED9_PEDHC|nr:uncharacterized protein Phum_PHUM131470 [Pediculus humanus corporis]EEB11745.1 conserved hypothetical protein [Pediculus humanus corporis]
MDNNNKNRIFYKKKLLKYYYLNSCLGIGKNLDLNTEIEGSEHAKRDKIVWKFLKRRSFGKNEFSNGKKCFLMLHGLGFHVLRSDEYNIKLNNKMVSASSTSAKNLFVESKHRLCDRVQVNVNNIAAIARQIQRGSKSNENLMATAKNFALQEAAIENSESNVNKLLVLSTQLNSQLEAIENNASKIEEALEQVHAMQR